MKHSSFGLAHLRIESRIDGHKCSHKVPKANKKHASQHLKTWNQHNMYPMCTIQQWQKKVTFHIKLYMCMNQHITEFIVHVQFDKDAMYSVQS